MTRVLVAYASKHGATAEIAAAIADQLTAADHDADCLPAEAVDELAGYDAVVLGSGVYMKRWLKPARHLLHRRELGERPLWLFSSGPCGTDPDPSWAEPRSIRTAAKRLEARDHTVFGGRLPLEPSNFMERGMLNATPPEHRDLRDWDEIRGWAAQIAIELAPQEGSTSAT
jgi:menaquinone-dependent protoporphyrinogen oxidase